MQRLPPEVKIEIFRNLIPLAVAHVMALIYQYRAYSCRSDNVDKLYDVKPFLWAVYYIAAVCQDWRALVQGTPSLWATTVLPLFKCCSRNRDTIIRFIQLHLRRSRTAPLDIHIASFWVSDTDDAGFFRPLWAHRSRIRSLTITPQPAPFYGRKAPTVNYPPDLPNLVHLAIGSDEFYYWNRRHHSPLYRCRSLSLIVQSATWFVELSQTYNNIHHLTLILMADYAALTPPTEEDVYAHMLCDMAMRWIFQTITTAMPNLRSLKVYFPSNVDPELTNRLSNFTTDFSKTELKDLGHVEFHGYDSWPERDAENPTFLTTSMPDLAVLPGVLQAATQLLAESQCSLSSLQTALPSPESVIPLAIHPRITKLLSLTLCADAGASNVVTQLCDVSFIPTLKELTLTVLGNDSRLGFDSMANLKKLLESRKLLRLSADTSATTGELDGYEKFITDTGVQGVFSFSCEDGVNARLNTDLGKLVYLP